MEELYRSFDIILKPTKDKVLIEKLKEYSYNSTSVYNAVLYMFRNLFSSQRKPVSEWSENEKEVQDIFNKTIPNLTGKINTYPDKYFVDKWFSKVNPWVSELGLPSHVKQKTIADACEGFVDFFKAMRVYNQNKSKFTGIPKLPKYKKKSHYRTFRLDSSEAKIKPVKGKENLWDLKIAKIKNPYKLTWVPEEFEKVQEIEVIPFYNTIKLKISYKVHLEKSTKPEKLVIAGLDPGTKCIATLMSPSGSLLVKGNAILSRVANYNKKLAKFKSELPNGIYIYTSKRIENLTKKQTNWIDYQIHSIAKYIVNWLVSKDVNVLVIGRNQGQKQNINLGSKTNQKVYAIPHCKLNTILEYLCRDKGIIVQYTEESYTSKSSFLEMDILPKYKEDSETIYKFKGRRITRDIYQTGIKRWYNNSYITVHADINGAGNIVRKLYPDYRVDLDILLKPTVIRSGKINQR